MNTKQRQNMILDAQLIGTILYIASLLLSYALTRDVKMDVLGKEKLFTDKQAQTLSVFNRSLVLGLTVLFLITSYINTDIAKEKGEDLESYQLQNRASELSVLSAVIVLYVILNNFGTSGFK